MIKIGKTKGNVLVELTQAEFFGLTKKSEGDVSDGTSFSLKWVKDAIDLIDNQQSKMLDLANKCDNLSSTVRTILNV